eukprot:jgi/Bigna1/138537/aug1.45_g13245
MASTNTAHPVLGNNTGKKKCRLKNTEDIPYLCFIIGFTLYSKADTERFDLKACEAEALQPFCVYVLTDDRQTTSGKKKGLLPVPVCSQRLFTACTFPYWKDNLVKTTLSCLVKGSKRRCCPQLSVILRKMEIFPSNDASTGLIEAFSVYAVAFLCRPISGVLLGFLGDKWGRKNTITLALAIMGFATLLAGATPGFQTIGIWSPILLCIARMLQGLSVGAQSTGSILLVLEKSAYERHGLLTSVLIASQLSGFILGGLIPAVMRLWLTPEAMQSYGWRIALWIGLIPCVITFITHKVDPYLIGMAARGVNAVLAAPLCLWLFSSPSLLRYAVVMAVMLPFLAFDFVSTTKILVPYFPAEGRYISMAIANNAGVGLTGGTAPMIAQYLIMSFDHGYVLLGCYVSAALFTATLSVLSLWCRPRCHFKGGPNCVSLSQEEVRNKDSPKMASFISNSKLSSQAITIREA